MPLWPLLPAANPSAWDQSFSRPPATGFLDAPAQLSSAQVDTEGETMRGFLYQGRYVDFEAPSLHDGIYRGTGKQFIRTNKFGSCEP